MATTQEQDIIRMKARIAELEAAAAKRSQLHVYISDKEGSKGTVSVAGLDRFPTSKYAEQWVALAAFMPTVLAFIKANENNPKMARKGRPVLVAASTPAANGVTEAAA